MSLVAQISAVVTQIGTTIKALTTRVGNLEAVPLKFVVAPTHVIDATDVGQALWSNGALTVNVSAGLGLTVGSVIYVRDVGFRVTVAADTSAGAVTLNTPNGAATTATGDWRAIVCTSANAFDVI